MHVKPGLVVRVAGKNWQPGAQVVIGLSAPNAQPQDSQPVTTALTDASGNFVALFPFPTDERWASLAEVWVVAHTRDFSKVAAAVFSYSGRPTATAMPIPTASAIPATKPASYVLGRVEDTSASARIIMVKPIEGQAGVIAIVESTQITYDGQPAQFQDIHIGDLVEASGQPSASNSIIADHIRILARGTVQPTATPTPAKPALVWRGEYYNNTTFSGNPLLVRNDPAIDFQWQDGAAAESLPVDNFAVRWTGSWPFETGAYSFYAQVDDGIRVWLDEHLIIDQWHESNGALYSAYAYLSASLHAVKVEYFDARANAHAKLWWEYRGLDAVQMYPDWKGEYYNNITLSGIPFLVVNERVLDFNWGTGAPASGMAGDNFSARWTRTVNLEEGLYRFYARADDGVQLWVDEIKLISHWQDGVAETYLGDLYLSSGSHNICAEYYEHTGQAVIKVWWELLPATPTPTSMPTQTPTPLPPTPTATYTPLPPTATPTPTPEPAPSTPQPTYEFRPTPKPGSFCPLFQMWT